MRILVVVHGFPPHAEGGSEVYVHAHTRALVREFGDEALVLTREADRGRPEYEVRTDTRDGLRVVSINNTFRNTRSFEESYRNEAIGAIARRVIDDFRPDVAHIHHLTCLSTTIVPRLAERLIPCVFTLHDYWLMCHRGQLLDVNFQVCRGPEAGSGCQRCLGPAEAAPVSLRVLARAARTLEHALPEATAAAMRRAGGRLAGLAGTTVGASSEADRRAEHMRGVCSGVTQFLAPSEHIRTEFVRFGIPETRITLSPLGFDHQPFKSIARTMSSRLRLGFLGSLMVSKAPHVLIEAARGLPRGSVTVDLFGGHADYHGDASYRHQLAPLLALDGVRHHGPIPHSAVPEALASIDVLVVPSIWPENSPLVIREAFLSGVPVVASRIGGIPEIVDDGRNGLLFEPGSVEDLRRMLACLLDEPGLLNHLRQGIGPVRSIEADATFTREIYETLLRPTDAGTPTSATRVAAVVLNHRTPDDTLLALHALLASRRLPDEIVVVDNDVDDPARAMVSGLGRGIHYVHTGRNLGYSGGINAGVRVALEHGASAVLLVNSDVVVAPDCLERLERAIASTACAGIAGPVVAERSLPGVVASLGLSYNPHTGRMREEGAGGSVSATADAITRGVDAVSGCAMLVTRDVLSAVGGFDEDYFFGFEDLDFCFRARRAGFETVLATDATVYHEGARSIGADSPRRLYFAARNHLLLAARHPANGSQVARLVRSTAIVGLNLAHALTARGGSWPWRLAAVARGTRDHLMGRYGTGSQPAGPKYDRNVEDPT